jgi:hypothetical protein
MTNIEPALDLVKILDLRPTQVTVGMREVAERRKRWHEKDKKKRKAYLGTHMVPVIRGPKDRIYVIDHHHLALALHQEGVDDILINVVANLTRLDEDSFWFTMENLGWMHLFDAHGKRCSPKELPKSVAKLKDDPYRSLAGELRRVGGFAKDTTPFSEFLWADFLRRRVERKRIEKSFASALEQALLLAKSFDADYLPGWCGASSVQSS